MPSFRPTWDDVHAAVDAARSRWSDLPDSASVTPERLAEIHAEMLAYARQISGDTHAATRRAVLYMAIYEDSQRNFMFPLIAAHGSLWGITHTESLDRLLSPLGRVSRRRVPRWRGALDDVRDVNRRVFQEIYTTFYFTRHFGAHPAAGEIVRPEVLALYNRVHEAIRFQRPLSAADRRDVYFSVFVHEQDDIVDPGLERAAAATGSPLFVRALKRVSPRFAYFPRGERLWFTDFTDVGQRNREGLRALDFAEEVGPNHVLTSMPRYSPWL
jgi:hypothetical protein